ncbi:hypothetical protein [Brucella pituitosa]|uniref:hypothetical protein n=1 Tax=Brucella pituitosa TaxID=571256 RepID=UPI0009A1825D|nr:hypothetical protein [Brucella pituitosa]
MLKLFIVLILFGSLTMSVPVEAAPERPACEASLLATLKKYVPEGFRIYKQLSDKSQFTTWFQCQDGVLDLATAVHESVHVLTEEQNVFPLVSGKTLARPLSASAFPPPKRIARELEALLGQKDIFLQTYLGYASDAVSSADDFLYLLDELNAFGHDLNTATKLADHLSSSNASHVDHRDGLAALMAFVSLYTESIRKNNPETWHGPKGKEVWSVVRILWLQSEEILSRSCHIPNFGTRAHNYIRVFCNAENSAALSLILGRKPLCPDACLSLPHL